MSLWQDASDSVAGSLKVCVEDKGEKTDRLLGFGDNFDRIQLSHRLNS